MVILHVLKSKIYSGAENVVCTIINNMPDDTRGVYLTASGPVEDKLKELGVEYVAVEKVTARVIRETVEKYKPDLIHAHDFTASVLSASLAKRIPVISHIHNNPLWIRHINLRTIVYQLSVRRFVKVLTVSSAVRDEFIFKKDLGKKLEVIGNPFDTEAVRAKGEYIREAKADLLFVGRLTDQKAPLDFIRVVEGVRKAHPDIKAKMLGDGELRGECEKLISQLGLEDTIEMPGFISNPYPYMMSCKVMVMPSLWEGFGLVALEGMCFGKPILARRVGGLQEIVNDNCGKLCEPSELMPLIDEANRLMTDEVYYQTKSKAALARANEYDNCQDYVNGIYNMYCDYIKKTTVLHVLKSKIYSGAENVVCTIINNMPSDINSVYLTAAGPVEDKLKELGIKYRAVPKVTARDIRESVHDYNAKIIHAHDFTASVLSAGMSGKLPVISHIHNNPPWIKYVNARTCVYAASVKRFSKVITVSSSVADEFVFKNELQNKIKVVGNPFDVENVRSKGFDLSGIPGEKNINSDLLFVGRLTEAKVPQDFIRIVAKVKASKPDVHAIIVGDGELREECMNLIAELNLTDTIEMVGFCGNPYPYMNATKLIAMPSLWEGFGLVALEGMCFGKPILATRVGGLKEIVTDACGILCDQGDTDSLVSEANRLLSDNEYYSSKSDAAKKRALEYDNCQTYVKGIDDIYRSIIKQKKEA